MDLSARSNQEISHPLFLLSLQKINEARRVLFECKSFVARASNHLVRLMTALRKHRVIPLPRLPWLRDNKWIPRQVQLVIFIARNSQVLIGWIKRSVVCCSAMLWDSVLCVLFLSITDKPSELHNTGGTHHSTAHTFSPLQDKQENTNDLPCRPLCPPQSRQ